MCDHGKETAPGGERPAVLGKSGLAAATAHAPLALSGRPQRDTGRLHIWEIGHGWCCSIIGTCLSHEDLMALARRRELSFDPEAKAYDVHAYFVNEAARDGRVARGLEKLLNERYAGALRKVARARSVNELAELWNGLVNSGQVAAGYWALLSHAHVPDELKVQVFGQVHMMSHLMGGSTRRIVGVAADLQARVEKLERQLERWGRQARAAVARRDEKVANLEQVVATERQRAAESAQRPFQGTDAPRERRNTELLQKRERALIAARTRARELENELDTLQRRLSRRPEAGPRIAAKAAEPILVPDLGGRHILYLGGRQGSVSAIQRTAAESRAVILHHDGGEEDSSHRLDDLVARCDAVVCPIDCISHGACLKAKQLCKRLRKPFMPIRSAGQATFVRALADLSRRFETPARAGDAFQ
ncbi:MAG: DUF2325 domain-containing protein [Parvibaculaceae bacterium]